MVSMRDSDAKDVIDKTAENLKNEMKMPDWARFVKTGVSRERPPEQDDWWYIRSASVLRRIYIDGPVGVSKLSSFYGGSKNRGHKPSHFRKGGGKILRTILQNLQALGYVETLPKGRKITPKGQKLLDNAVRRRKN
ncbi:MAG: 30S ribosomal protein S19e [Candidatus Aenigmarchaeota archaeon]|nr:30S ribosomal protein S19e [Candidatus Aenigmarchaeota archaeon]